MANNGSASEMPLSATTNC